MFILKGLAGLLATPIVFIGVVIGGYLGNKLFRSSSWIGTSQGIWRKRLQYIVIGALIGAAPGGLLMSFAGDDSSVSNGSSYEKNVNDDQDKSTKKKTVTAKTVKSNDIDKEQEESISHEDKEPLVSQSGLTDNPEKDGIINPYAHLNIYFKELPPTEDGTVYYEPYLVLRDNNDPYRNYLAFITKTNQLPQKGENVVYEITEIAAENAEKDGYTFSDTELRFLADHRDDIHEFEQIPESTYSELKKIVSDFHYIDNEYDNGDVDVTPETVYPVFLNGSLYKFYVIFSYTLDSNRGLQPGDAGYDANIKKSYATCMFSTDGDLDFSNYNYIYIIDNKDKLRCYSNKRMDSLINYVGNEVMLQGLAMSGLKSHNIGEFDDGEFIVNLETEYVSKNEAIKDMLGDVLLKMGGQLIFNRPYGLVYDENGSILRTISDEDIGTSDLESDNDSSWDNLSINNYSNDDSENMLEAENSSYEEEFETDNSNDDEFNSLIESDLSEYELTDANLEGLTPQELTYLRNSIYAKYGYVFQSDELNEFFNNFPWYHPDPDITVELDGLEEVNAGIILQYQEKNNKIYQPE